MPVRYFEQFRAPAPTVIGRGATGANLGSRSWCPEPEVRHQIRGRLDDAGGVAPPRNSANYSSSSRLASAADPPPTLATDFGSGTLPGLGRRSRDPVRDLERYGDDGEGRVVAGGGREDAPVGGIEVVYVVEAAPGVGDRHGRVAPHAERPHDVARAGRRQLLLVGRRHEDLVRRHARVLDD